MTLALLSATWIVGLLLGFALDLAPLPVLLLTLSTLPLALLLRLLRCSMLPAILIATLLLGIWRVEAREVPGLALVAQDSQEVSLRGRIANDPEPTARLTRFALEVEAVDLGQGWQELSGRALVYSDPPDYMIPVREPPYFRQGDALVLDGILQRPEPIEDFDYPTYLSSQGISGVFWSRKVEWISEDSSRNPVTASLFDLRRSLSNSLESSLPQPQTSLAQALLLGLRGGMPEEVKEDFRNSGAAHLLAISGLHVGILLAITIGASAGVLGRQRQMYLSLPFAAIWAYALISGLPVSVTRAALMGSLYLLALALGRPQSALPALALSAMIITAFDPLALTQISFQLSFAAMTGIVVALPYQARLSAAIQRRISPAEPGWSLWAKHLGIWLASAIIVSLGATLATLPLVALNFNQIPLMSIPITILALPSLPFILGGSFLTALAGLVHPALGQVIGVTAWAPLSYLLALVSLAPGVTLSGGWVSTPVVCAWYVALSVLLLRSRLSSLLRRVLRYLSSVGAGGNRAQTQPLKLKPSAFTLTIIGSAIVISASAAFLWTQLLSSNDGNLHVYFFDVGQGDSAFIVTPSGRQVLVDGGPEAESATLALSQTMSPMDRSLDLIALTHLDADHSRGLLEVLDRYRVGTALVGIEDPASPLFPQWQDRISSAEIEVVKLSAGARIVLDEEVVLETLNPAADPLPGSTSDRNNNSLVFRLTYRDISFLLAADIEATAEGNLSFSTTDIGSDVLKVAHHGSQTSSTAEFLERVSPSVAVISAGENNRYGHPHPDVVARLEQTVGAQGIYRTWEHGTVEFISNGRDLWVETSR